MVNTVSKTGRTVRQKNNVRPHLHHKIMKTQVPDVDTLQKYLTGVLTRADHHAGNVNEIALAVAGAIVWRKDSSPIEVMTHSGDMKNVLWVTMQSGQRYAFSYNHQAGAIEIRQGSTQGAVTHSVTNATPLSQLRSIFLSL